MTVKKSLLLAALLVSACNQAAQSVYDDPLPKSDDTDALTKIKEGIKPDDADAWQNITMMIIMPTAKRPTSKTVGQAISRYKAQESCENKHDFTKVGEGPKDFGAPDYEKRQNALVARYNKEVDEYNACLKMPV